MPEFTQEGRYYTFNGAICMPKPLQSPHPPVLIGGHGEVHLFRAVARYADICNVGFEMTPEEHKAKLQVLAEHCHRVGREPAEIEVSHNTRVKIAATEAELRDVLAARADAAGKPIADYEDSLKSAISGTPDQCAARIQIYVDMGITYFFLIFPDPIGSEDLELFANEVMGRFTQVSGQG